jgi:hypothetical protein
LNLNVGVEPPEKVDINGIHDPAEFAGPQVPLADLIYGSLHKGGNPRFGKGPDLLRHTLLTILPVGPGEDRQKKGTKQGNEEPRYGAGYLRPKRKSPADFFRFIQGLCRPAIMRPNFEFCRQYVPNSQTRKGAE